VQINHRSCLISYGLNDKFGFSVTFFGFSSQDLANDAEDKQQGRGKQRFQINKYFAASKSDLVC